MLKNVDPNDLVALANITKHTLDYEWAFYVDEAEEEPGRLCIEGGKDSGASRDEMGAENIFDEVYLAVATEEGEKFEATVSDATIYEAFELVTTMSQILGL